MILGNLQKYVSTNRSLFSVKLYRPVSVIIWQLIVYQTLFKSTMNGAVPSQELRTVLCVVVMLLRVNFKFWNRFTCSKGPIKRTGKVCGDFQDLKSPGEGGGGGNFWKPLTVWFSQESSDFFQVKFTRPIWLSIRISFLSWGELSSSNAGRRILSFPMILILKGSLTFSSVAQVQIERWKVCVNL